jgi:hypothetical protein
MRPNGRRLSAIAQHGDIFANGPNLGSDLGVLRNLPANVNFKVRYAIANRPDVAPDRIES